MCIFPFSDFHAASGAESFMMGAQSINPVTVFLTGITILFSQGCVYLPRGGDEAVSQAITANPDSLIMQMLGQPPETVNRALLIEDPDLALVSRIHMIEAAQSSIDLQYFIWKNDFTGILLIEKLLQAADRGVRVRALVDDFQISGLTGRLSALNQHPNVEIRIFNPFSVRLSFPFELFRLTEFAIDGNRLNHRMHNKLLVADNQLALLGGRNIGDEYFGKSEDWNFIDMDILLAGEIIPALSQGFDTYWNSNWAYPVKSMTRVQTLTPDFDVIRNRIHERLLERQDLYSLVDNVSFEETLRDLLQSPQLLSTRLLVDDPDVSWFQRPDETAIMLAELAAEIKQEVIIVTPYLVPTPNLQRIAGTLVERGVKITVLTNSLATNNHTAAHASYAKYRQRILDLGIDIHELRQDAALGANIGTTDISLHSKYLIFDDEFVFVGSLNLDPRSLYLNTELGLMMNSPALVRELRESFNQMIQPENSFRLTSTDNGIEWRLPTGVTTQDPAHNGWQRIKFWFLRLLPISSQL